MLTITRQVRDAILAHARRELPFEACGVVTGPRGTSRAERHIELVNSARSRVAYDVDPREMLLLYQDLDGRGEEIIIAYHSHPGAQAYPSPTDIGYATAPDVHYVIVSIDDGRERGEFRSFRIADGQVTEEDVVIQPARDSKE